jgi:BASS family bile acid:Na+ symporter
MPVAWSHGAATHHGAADSRPRALSRPRLALNLANELVVPAAAALILFSLGLTLDPGALRHLVSRPRALAVGLAVRLLFLPLAAVLLCLAFQPAPSTVLGLLLVAACPLGTPTAALVRAAGGDTALALALTATTNLLSAVTLPLLLEAGASLAGVQGAIAALGVGASALRVGALVTVPVMLGLVLRRARPALAARLEPRVTPFVLVLLLPVVGLTLYGSREALLPSLAAAGGLALGLNLTVIGLAWLLARSARLEPGEAVAVLLGAGLYNFGLAAFVSLTLLRDARVLLPGLAYGLVMLGTAAVLVAWFRRAAPAQRGSTR